MIEESSTDLSGQRGRSDGRQVARWLAVGTFLYVSLGLLGRATIPDGEELSLVWPAAGVATLLFGLLAARWWVLAAVLVAASTVTLHVLTGADASLAAVFAATNVVQGIGTVLLLRAMTPHLIGAGGREPLVRLQDFWAVVGACLLASLAGAAVGSIGRGLLDDWTGVDDAAWWARNATGNVAVVVTGIFAVAAWRQVRRRGGGVRLRARSTARATEMLLLVAVTVLLYLAFILADAWLQVAFPLLVPTVWAGLRFGPLSVAVHSLAVSVTVVVFTLNGRGPFANMGSWPEQVLVSQLFLGMVFCLGTLLALSRGERLSLTRTLSTARESAQRQAELMSTIIDSMHDGVSLIDESGQVVRRNPAGAELARTSTDSLKHVRESRFRLKTLEGHVLTMQEFPWVRAMAGEDVVEEDLVMVFEDGSPSRTLAVSARRLPPMNGTELRHAVVIYHDVTADRAQRSALESFAGVVAHDLLGPLGAVDGWAELLAGDLADSECLTRPEAEPKVERIRAGTQRMRRLIHDLLESSTSRDQQLRRALVDLESVARTVAEHRPEMSSRTPPNVEVGALPPAYADRAMVRQLFDNLIGNAVKYVEPGEVARVTITGRLADDMVEVTVADRGIGISADQRDQVFGAFHRAPGALAYDGHGIGLSVCERIVERHGGRISVRAPLGERGTRIVFSLPAAPPER